MNGIDVLITVAGVIALVLVCDLVAWAKWNSSRKWERLVARGLA